MNKKRVYIAGCGGMLGDAMYKHWNTTAEVLATDINVCEPWLQYCDVRDFHQTAKLVDSFKPDVIMNLAALTDLEQCEHEPENAWLTNALGAENLGLIAARHDVPYLYISTAGIFGGDAEIYTDFDRPEPRSVYARSKFYGEEFALRSVPRHFVLRAGWMMGGGPAKDKKFINKIYQQIKAGAGVLNVVDDKAGTPTYTVDFARNSERVIQSGLYGLYNQVCGGSGTRFEVACEFVKNLDLEDRVEIRSVDSSFFAQTYFAHRPSSERLVNTKLHARNLNGMRDWRVCLQEYCAVFAADFEGDRRQGDAKAAHGQAL
ncbi:MAG TPA: NAD(P)-dependent oxidoreductase [Terriglobales bacterium]|nr:NAD(P)-dependent oxidoreductase [Terriglobales bacterium]